MGDTPEDALRNFFDNWRSYLDVAEERGMLPQLLEDYGLKPERSSIAAVGTFSFSVPYEDITPEPPTP